jgi:hypothetical protein
MITAPTLTPKVVPNSIPLPFIGLPNGPIQVRLSEPLELAPWDTSRDILNQPGFAGGCNY